MNSRLRDSEVPTFHLSHPSVPRKDASGGARESQKTRNSPSSPSSRAQKPGPLHLLPPTPKQKLVPGSPPAPLPAHTCSQALEQVLFLFRRKHCQVFPAPPPPGPQPQADRSRRCSENLELQMNSKQQTTCPRRVARNGKGLIVTFVSSFLRGEEHCRNPPQTKSKFPGELTTLCSVRSLSLQP